MVKKCYMIGLLLMVTALGLSRVQYYDMKKQFVEADTKAGVAEVQMNKIQEELDAANGVIADLKSDEYEFIYIGEYTLTHYCIEKKAHICGTGSGKTATGTKVTAGRSVAVDPRVITYGTQMYIEGYGFRTAEDCGGGVKDKHIDVAVETHDIAMALGRTKAGVWLLVEK